MHSRWSSSSFLSFSKFPLIQEGGPKFFRETNSAKRLNYLVTPSVFQEFEGPNSATFSRAQCILHDAAVPFSNFENFFKLKSGDIFSCGEKILQNGWIIWSPPLYFNFNNLKDPNFAPFTRFQCILHDAGVLFSLFGNYRKFNKGDLISCGEPILQNSWIIWIRIYYSILRISVNQILRQSLDFNSFYMMQQSLSQFFNIS